VHSLPCSTDKEVIEKTKKEVSKKHDFICAHLTELGSRIYSDQAPAALAEVNENDSIQFN
jgi:hypothetical protein